jgi:leader peptidase (prepilin peptidase)/N-methyltransferase
MHFESIFLYVSFFVVGSLIGSFLNVVIYRWPREESVVSPRSKCPACEKLIPWYYNVPIFGWLFLRGKAACCGVSISWRYPLVEFLTGALFALTFHFFGLSFQAFEYCLFVSMAVPCVFIDLDHYLLPDVLTLPGIAIGLAGSFISDTRTFLSAVFGVVLGGGLFWFMSWFYERYRNKEGMGFGDVKLLAWLGALGGVSSIFFIVFVSSILGTLAGLYVIAFRGGSRHSGLPFGPFLIFAAFLYYYLGEFIQSSFPGLFLFIF